MKFLRGCMVIIILVCAVFIAEIQEMIDHIRGVKHAVEDFADIADTLNEQGKLIQETLDILHGKDSKHAE